MNLTVTTTITSTITVGEDGIEGVEHSVEIDAGIGALPTNALTAVVGGGLKSALQAVEAGL